MKPFILIAVIISVAGCQTTSSTSPSVPFQEAQVPATPSASRSSSAEVRDWTLDSLVGSGPLTISATTRMLLNEEYMRYPTPGFFIIASNGELGAAHACPYGPGICKIDEKVRTSIRECEDNTQTQCHIFAKGHEILWNGPITYREGELVDSDLTGFSSKFICMRATHSTSSGIRWNGVRNVQPFVKEARSRGLSPLGCLASFMRFRDSPKIDTSINDVELCSRALSKKAVSWAGEKENWNYVREAVRRGHNEMECVIELVKAKGSVTIGNTTFSSGASGNASRQTQAAKKPKTIKEISDKMLCHWAAHGGQWSTFSQHQHFVREAKSRGLHPVACKRMTKIPERVKLTNTGGMSDMSDQAICTLSVNADSWGTTDSARRYIAEAKSRNLSPAKCNSLLN